MQQGKEVVAIQCMENGSKTNEWLLSRTAQADLIYLSTYASQDPSVFLSPHPMHPATLSFSPSLSVSFSLLSVVSLVTFVGWLLALGFLAPRPNYLLNHTSATAG